MSTSSAQGSLCGLHCVRAARRMRRARRLKRGALRNAQRLVAKPLGRPAAPVVHPCAAAGPQLHPPLRDPRAGLNRTAFFLALDTFDHVVSLVRDLRHPAAQRTSRRFRHRLPSPRGSLPCILPRVCTAACPPPASFLATLQSTVLRASVYFVMYYSFAGPRWVARRAGGGGGGGGAVGSRNSSAQGHAPELPGTSCALCNKKRRRRAVRSLCAPPAKPQSQPASPLQSCHLADAARLCFHHVFLHRAGLPAVPGEWGGWLGGQAGIAPGSAHGAAQASCPAFCPWRTHAHATVTPLHRCRSWSRRLRSWRRRCWR